MAELVTKADLQQAIALVNERIDRFNASLNERIDRTNDRFERQTLQLTVRLGLMLAAAIAIFSTILGVLGKLN
jgi:hypothetical protein